MRAAGVDARWFVLDGDEEFFAVTRRLHNAVRGLGDPAGLGPAAHLTYQRVLARTLPRLLGMVGRRDLVMLHDPQTAGLVSPLRRAGVRQAECRRVLTRAGLLSAHGVPPAPPGIQGAPPPGPGARLVAQVSRWDRLKDMAGVMAGLARAEPPGDVQCPPR